MDWHTAFLTFKTSIPPAVLVCATQSHVWMSYFGLNAYLAPIGAAGAMATYPQGMLIEFNAKQVFGFVVAYCWSLLAGWCGLQARIHTSKTPEDLQRYNSSAEAVVAVLLIFGMWFTFTVKSAFPSWNIQVSVSAILGIAVMPSVARLPTMHSIIQAATPAFVALLAGQSLGFVSALLIFPQTCRSLFKRDAISSLGALRTIMLTHKTVIQDIVARTIPSSSDETGGNESIENMETALQQLGNEVAKASGHVEHAARELSWGVYHQSELDNVCAMLVQIMPPVSGLSLIADMIQRKTEANGVVGQNGLVNGEPEDARSQTDERQGAWQNVELEMEEQLCKMTEMISAGAEHVRIRLRQSQKRSWPGRARRRTVDEESRGTASPGGPQFIEHYREMFKDDGEKSLSRHQVLHHYVLRQPHVGTGLSPDKHAETLRYFTLLHVCYFRPT